MATGDISDITARLRSYLPAGWFPSDQTQTPILNAVLTGVTTILAGIYALYVYVKAQTRIGTATGGWLDLIAQDFFGTNLLRGFNESDSAFRAQIKVNLFRARGTRQSVIDILTELTGYAPKIIEPGLPADTGAYDLGGVGYDVGGAYGDLPVAQAFVIAYRQPGTGIPLLGGYDSPVGAYDTGSQIEYIDSSMYAGSAPDSAIYAAVNSVRPAGVILWVQIQNGPPPGPPSPLPYYPPAFPFTPPPGNAVITSDGSYLVDSAGDYIVHS
ncbi:hypothetical protein [Burkholderia multivorans]|uniref:hypothetical protein n=1 Tax=Burkholderia multivorans TaxID=87883 RepID=UPI0021C20F21|nr:hypothetical protein [Burkholderia multivorans]MDR9052050.1 hypothetical protein [Burkholderia multivorans]MDR9060122.1 hypothetical protein [Burkholderia multivorans]MDR9062427.1 hypothetical protein [Burkholderia multivorans]MDR9072225.1 hypothetical protein [Burkholderia multivorans]MDR9076550.1 hypothetical protein [Burkholderia multivorans]